jgi:alpha-1,2-mannosyltransferase
MIGATRGKDDEAIVEQLKELAIELNVNESVKFYINKPREEIMSLFSRSKVAVHTMKEEHFGISIVEMMSAGLIVIAHNSAGPKMDIIGAAN